ncbi:conserved hypothetical protein [Ricinus communis]|uniref:Uncharacterized protein n=1 Tax=Ricinus communis TaxID=3988 RepID=B9SW47_RICCO|nr:conserved hypothetical protein [Ricinus communis]
MKEGRSCKNVYYRSSDKTPSSSDCLQENLQLQKPIPLNQLMGKRHLKTETSQSSQLKPFSAYLLIHPKLAYEVQVSIQFCVIAWQHFTAASKLSFWFIPEIMELLNPATADLQVYAGATPIATLIICIC